MMAGCYGKVPALGDFLSRNLPATFVEAWDGWLRTVMAACARGGDGWVDRYLAAPIWRFALAPNTVGELGRAGILVPSVDRIGRCFPISVIVAIPAGVAASDMANVWAEGFERAEVLALGVIDRALDAEAFVTRVAELAPPDPSSAPPLFASERWTGNPPTRLGVRTLGAPPGIAGGRETASNLALELLSRSVGGYSLWWHLGWEDWPASTVLFSGLPPAEAACSMLIGPWKEWGWSA
jgi:type VI secretion system protein ImpM